MGGGGREWRQHPALAHLKARRFADNHAQNFPDSPRCGGRRSRDADRNPAPHRARWGACTNDRRRHISPAQLVRRRVRAAPGRLCGEARRQQADRISDQRHAGRARSALELHGFQELPRHAGADPRRVRRPRHRVTMEDGLIKVVAPIDETPAAKAGIMANDIITHLDDAPVQGLTLNQAVEKMRGPENSKIKLKITRKGQDKPIEISITRARIQVRSVRSRLEGDDVGFIRVTQFNEQTTQDLKKAITDLSTQAGDKLKSFIIDLRNNPGGLLDQAISVSDAFLEKGEIVSTRGRNAEETQRFNARAGDLTKNKPVIVLINGGSASASEIVAGALQDHRRATVIGTRSFGKGSVQTIIPLGSGNGALRLTTARYFTPSGRSIQAKGISPDIEVLQEVPEELKARTDTSGEASLRGHLKAEGDEQTGSQSYIPPDPKDDKALHTALDLIRGIQKNSAYPPNPKTAVPN